MQVDSDSVRAWQRRKVAYKGWCEVEPRWLKLSMFLEVIADKVIVKGDRQHWETQWWCKLAGRRSAIYEKRRGVSRGRERK